MSRFLDLDGFLYGTAAEAAESAWATPDNTGVPTGTVLTPWGGGTQLGPGTYTDTLFSTAIDLSAGVTAATPAIFVRCRFVEGINNFVSGGGRWFHATDCDFGTTALETFALGAQDFTATRCKILGSDGVRWSKHNATLGGTRGRLEDCYIACWAVNPAHGDGLQADFADGPMDIVGCTFDMRNSDSYTAGVYWGDGCTVPPGETGTLIDGCLFLATGVYGTKMATVSGHVIRNCVFVGYGPGEWNDGAFDANIATWTNNRSGTINGWNVTPGAEIARS